MKKPLPDYYAILKVAPGAAPEAIKASYRRLMVTLKMHPDLGGNHEIAARINEAYAVLGDPAKRIVYARMYLLQRLQLAQVAAHAKQPRASNDAKSRPANNSSTAKSKVTQSNGCCPLCRNALPRSIGPETRCEHCRSPLYPPPQPGAYGQELFGRRASSRSAKSHLGKITLAGQSSASTVKMRDLSLNGISFYCENAIAVDQVFSFRDQTLEAVAVVVYCRKRGPLYSVHARLVTVAFHYKAGVFMSSSG